MTDAGYHDPDIANGHTRADVVRRSLEIDPVNVFSVVPPALADDERYVALSLETSGEVFVDTGDASDALVKVFETIEERPVVLLSAPQYEAQPGQTVTFSAADSYAARGDIVEFAWDFDGDGTLDQVTADPSVDHAYATERNGYGSPRN